MSDKLDVIPLFHVMKRGTGRRSHLERYDVDKQIWIPTLRSALTNMCERPHQCTACDSFHATIEKPLEERRDHFQPALHRMEKSRIIIPVRAVA